MRLFQTESVKEIYGIHNLPGLPLGYITTRPATFACASSGLVLQSHAKAAHAAYQKMVFLLLALWDNH